MILFVFEGGKAEPMLFDSIGELFLSKEELCVLKCEHDLPTLYSNLRANEYDLFRSLPFKENNIYLPEDKRLDTLFSQIFLFFDYDFQNRLGTQKVNGILDEMLDFFSDETENGKLYINYPMIESLKYTKEIPDANYRPILRGRDIKRYSYDWAGLWLIWIPWHFPLHLDSSIQGSSAEAEQAFMDQYPSVYQHLLLYKPQLSARNKAETGIRYEWYALQRWGANYSGVYVQQQGTTCGFSGPAAWVVLTPIEQSIKRKIESVGKPLRDWDINIFRGVLTGYNGAFIITTERRDEILSNCKSEEERQRTEAIIRRYVATREECASHKFKGNAERFAYSEAKAFRFIDLVKTERQKVADNWEKLKFQNVCKANYLVSDSNTLPLRKSTINQKDIFEAQKSKYVDINESVAILNSFPIFLYDYLK